VNTDFMALALRLARRGYGSTSPNPMVGAVLEKAGKIIGRGWHRRAGEPHAEIDAIRDAERRGYSTKGATLHVTLEPCSTHGRTGPCTETIIDAGIKTVVAGATDPNPRHSGKGFEILKRAGLRVVRGVMAEPCERLNEAFNHWIVRRAPFVTVKAAMTLDGKIATAAGESKWITGEQARAYGMNLRQGADAILVGIQTVLADNPSLTYRAPAHSGSSASCHQVRRLVLDGGARTPLTARVVSDEFASLTTIVAARSASERRVAALARRVRVLRAPSREDRIDLPWLLEKLGSDNIINLLVEGGGEVNASFLLQGLAQRITFFYAPKILGGRDSRRALSGEGATRLSEVLDLTDLLWRRLGPDLLLTARIKQR
jgi:diaminohydroxyphosphoribosylaminopyrimidine deaminase/5-amino-6-(5-phosphoribosylamino)uracil reductase